MPFASIARRLGDDSTIYPIIDGEKIGYVFRDAWGDCPAGCTESKLYYFIFDIKHKPVLVGSYRTGLNVEPPAWWQGIRPKITDFRRRYYIPEMFSQD